MVQAIPLFWQVFFLSMFPLGELRAAIPLGIAMGMDALPCFLAAFFGNMLPVLPVLFLLSPLDKMISRSKMLSPFWLRLQKYLRNKGEKAQYYGALGLFLIVAVPLPLTGAWSGCFIAWLLGMSYDRAMLAIAAGVFTAGVIIMIFSLGIIQYGLPVLFMTAAIAVGYIIKRRLHKIK